MTESTDIVKEESWRERCETCEIADSCFLKHCASYCSGVIDVTPLISMIMEAAINE